jgi:hypothetical protein
MLRNNNEKNSYKLWKGRIVMLRNKNDKTFYELWKGRLANVKHFRVFGSKCYIKREDGRMGKIDSRVDKGVLVGYSSTRKAYKLLGLYFDYFIAMVESFLHRYYICY